MTNSFHTYRREVTIPSELSALSAARLFIETCAAECGFNQQDVFQIALAVDEACSNIIRHAYDRSDEATITLKAEDSLQGLVISIIDTARPFDPLQVESPDMNDYFKKFKRGGLGVHLMRKIMDKIEYFPSSSRQPINELRLTKLRP